SFERNPPLTTGEYVSARPEDHSEGDHMTIAKTGALTTALLAGALATSLPLRAQAQDAPPPPPPPAAEPAPPPPPAPPAAPAAPAAPVVTAAPAPEATPAVSTEVTNKVQHKKMDPPAIWFRLDNQIKSKDPANAKK